MADVAAEKKRKSVSFSDGAIAIDGDGVTNGDSKPAEKGTVEAAVDQVTDMFKDLAKKKKKKSKKEDGTDGDKAEGGDEGLDMSGLKKKKKKKPKTEDFDAKLAEVGEGGEDGTAAATADGTDSKEQEGDMLQGTGIWQHDATESIQYPLLLHRFFVQLHDRHPDLIGASGKNYKIPPPQCFRDGNKKTIFANLLETSKRLKRNEEHVIQFLLAEMGTTGSVDGNKRLVIKGKFSSKQIENILRRYIQEYVSCKTCRSLNTEIAKGENRLWYITCQSCGSRRTVPAIKTGVVVQVGKRKRAQG